MMSLIQITMIGISIFSSSLQKSTKTSQKVLESSRNLSTGIKQDKE